MDEAGRTLRPANASFWGGVGACSVAVGLVSLALSPSGPRGSTVSSTASSLVACALILRVPRGPRRAGDRGACTFACCDDCSGAMRRLVSLRQGNCLLFWARRKSRRESTYWLRRRPISMTRQLGESGRAHLSTLVSDSMMRHDCDCLLTAPRGIPRVQIHERREWKSKGTRINRGGVREEK